MSPPTTAKLKTLCRVHDISGYSGKRKSGIVKLVKKNYAELITTSITNLEQLVLKLK